MIPEQEATLKADAKAEMDTAIRNVESLNPDQKALAALGGCSMMPAVYLDKDGTFKNGAVSTCSSEAIAYSCSDAKTRSAGELAALNKEALEFAFTSPIARMDIVSPYIKKVEEVCEIANPPACSAADIESGKCL